jgi:hypothetical protein
VISQTVIRSPRRMGVVLELDYRIALSALLETGRALDEMIDKIAELLSDRDEPENWTLLAKLLNAIQSGLRDSSTQVATSIATGALDVQAIGREISESVRETRDALHKILGLELLPSDPGDALRIVIRSAADRITEKAKKAEPSFEALARTEWGRVLTTGHGGVI